MATASPATVESSPLSFHTPTGASPTQAEDETTLSSPGELVAARAYCGARQLPHELKENVRIFLEEKMYSAAIHLLESLLSPGASRQRGDRPPAWVPPTSQIAMLASLAIHPDMTSRVIHKENATVAARSLRYLRELVAIVGPVEANLRAAFEFAIAARGGRRTHGAGSRDGTPLEGEDDTGSDEDRVHDKFARHGSVWSRGQDFWCTVGWAFNCSAVHPHRWQYWRPWLDFMVDVLEADFEERERLDRAAHERQGGGDGTPEWISLQGALVVDYASCMRNRMSLKDIFMAMLADGSQSRLARFPEVFEKELKLVSQSKKRKRTQTLDIENGQFGDWMDDVSYASSQGSEAGSPEKIRAAPPKRTTARDERPPDLSVGFEESVPLRLKLFYLIAKVALYFPTRFEKLSIVYDTFSDAIRELPLGHFAPFVNSATTSLPDDAYVALLKNVASTYISRSAPEPMDIDPDAERQDGISVLMLEECYLPWPANTTVVENNGKLSMVVENLLRLMWARSNMSWTQTLQRAVEQGVTARKDKTKSRKNEDEARAVLKMSGERMLTILKVMKLDDDSDEENSLTSFSGQ